MVIYLHVAFQFLCMVLLSFLWQVLFFNKFLICNFILQSLLLAGVFLRINYTFQGNCLDLENWHNLLLFPKGNLNVFTTVCAQPYCGFLYSDKYNNINNNVTIILKNHQKTSVQVRKDCWSNFLLNSKDLILVQLQFLWIYYILCHLEELNLSLF